LTSIFAGIKIFPLNRRSSTGFGLRVKESKCLEVQRDASQGGKTVEVEQLTSEAERFEIQREVVSSMENVGDKRLSTWKK